MLGTGDIYRLEGYGGLFHQELLKASNKLTTTPINLKRKFPSRVGKLRQSRGIKEEKKKVKILKEKRLQQRAYSLLEKLTARELAGEVFDAYKNNNSFTSIATINAELTEKLIRRLHLYPLLWLPEKGGFNTKIARNMRVIEVSLNEDSSDEEAIQELTEGEI